MRTIRLGSGGPEMSRVGLGCMAMSNVYGPADERESIATIHAALERGINLLDTGDFYGMGHNELLIARALEGRRREDVLISVKFGARRGPDGGFLGQDASPPAVKSALAYSLRRLNTDYVDVCRQARLDPRVPIEDTVSAIGEMIDAGYVRHVGLSELGPEAIRRAASTRPVTDLQIEYSLISRTIEQEILPVCRELGIAITAYGVLSRGLISGHYSPGRAGDPRARMFPRFNEQNLQRNLALVEQLRELADSKGASIAQLAIAWVLSRGEDIVPLIGARRRDQLAESLGALELELSAEDLERIVRAMPADAAAGERYGAEQMTALDSER